MIIRTCDVCLKLEYVALLPMPQPRHFYHFPQVRVTLLGWCKVKVDWNWGLGEMWKGVLECHTGRRVRIFGIDTKNLACWAGCK
jgi:hypothetical protein